MNHSGIPQIHSNGEENSLSSEERLIRSLSPHSLSEAYDQKRKARQHNRCALASLLKSANEPRRGEFFCTIIFLPKMCMGRAWDEVFVQGKSYQRKGLRGGGRKRDLKRRMSPFYGCAIHVPIKPR